MADNCLRRDSSGRLAFEMFRVAADDYPAVCQAISSAFSLAPQVETFCAGLDAVFMGYRRGEHAVELAWDNWSGFTVTAKIAGSEPLVREIAAWLLASNWI